MLCKAKDLKGYTLKGLDGEIGEVEEFYFDDQHWTIRYLVANTGDWLSGRQVLISPYALGAIDKEGKHIAIALTKQQIEDSPSLENDKPVSRQFEESYYAYYGWPIYWSSPYMWGPFPFLVHEATQPESNEGGQPWDAHLRSTKDVCGHHVQATDGEIGHVEDFIVDDQTWAIRYLIVDTRNWWPGKRVLVSPKWMEHVSWEEEKVHVDLARDAIRNSPEYTEEALLTREYETGLHEHYDRPGYWSGDAPGGKKPSQ